MVCFTKRTKVRYNTHLRWGLKVINSRIMYRILSYHIVSYSYSYTLKCFPASCTINDICCWGIIVVKKVLM